MLAGEIAGTPGSFCLKVYVWEEGGEILYKFVYSQREYTEALMKELSSCIDKTLIEMRDLTRICP